MKLYKTAQGAALAAVALVMLSSCHIYQKFSMPDDTPLTREYIEGSTAERDSAAFGNLTWDKVYTDPLLQDYIRRALANNNDLENARLNVEVARANQSGARLAYLPSVALSPNGAGASYAGSDINWTYNVPMAISWEIDIFAKLLNSKRSAEAALRLQQDYLQAVNSQIITAVATCYYTLATLQEQLQLNEATARIWEENVQIMEAYKEAGRVTQAAVAQSRAQLISVKAAITDIRRSMVQANNNMSLLLNVMPQTWEITPNASLEVPEILREGLPMRELANRPDVRAAEEQLAIAYYTTNQARAAFYPSITLSSNGGFTNLLGSFIKNPGDWFVQLAGQLAMPLFARGQNMARLKGAKAKQQQALNNFEYKLLAASGEIYFDLVAVDKTSLKAKLYQEQIAHLQEAVDATTLLMQYDGKTTYLEVLTAQQSLLSAQMNALNNKLTHEQWIINLYQALGGGATGTL